MVSVLAERVAAALGLALLELFPLAEGATARAVRLETNRGTFVLRVAQPHPGKRAGFASDVRVRAELLKGDERVSRPVAHAGTHPDLSEVAWCLDAFVEGSPPTRGEIPPRVCRELGEVLAHLHALEASGYGLLEPTSSALKGCCDAPAQGIRSRLQDPWPFSDQGLEQHPPMMVAPHLISNLEALREDILAITTTAPVICHTDLHERQLLLRGGRLAALLDFGDAALGPPIWVWPPSAIFTAGNNWPN